MVQEKIQIENIQFLREADSRYAFMQHSCQAKLHYIDIKAQDYGLKAIGYMGYFRQSTEKIWDEALNTFSELYRLKYAV